MTATNSYVQTSPEGEKVYQIDKHSEIPFGTFIPEIKGAEGLHAILNHVTVLEHQNPIMVPASAYQWLRTKNGIQTRTDENGNEVGDEEVEILEENHPIIYYDPPELYNFVRSARLFNYYLKGDKSRRNKIKATIRSGDYEEGIGHLPTYIQKFIDANEERFIEEIDGASQPIATKFDYDSTDEVWLDIEKSDFKEYFSELVTDASDKSVAMVPSVPLLEQNLESSKVTATCMANSTMADLAREEGVDRSFFHIYMDYQCLSTGGSGSGVQLLNIVQKEIENGEFGGIALTIRNPHLIDQAGLLARTETFLQNLVDIGHQAAIPVIAPRSEWLGSLLTDNGLAAYSDLMNSGWEYGQDRSEGGPGLADQYGKTIAYQDAKRLRVDPPSNKEETLIEYIQNGNLTQLDGLPNQPPGNITSGQSLQQQLGTPREFRIKFSKPRKLAQIYEAQEIREKRSQGEEQPAREYLVNSENPYILV